MPSVNSDQQDLHQKALSNYTPGHKPSHITNHTLRTADNSAAHLLPRLTALRTTNSSLQLLDIGAGPGTLSASLAQFLAPTGHVVATDISADVLSQAAAHAASLGVTNISFQPADVTTRLPFGDGSFDVVHMSQVLTHLSEDARERAVREMLRVTKPGGTVSLREVDMRMWSVAPASEALDRFHELLRQTMEARGGARDMGPRLLGLVLKAGGVAREKVEMGMGSWCYSTRAEKEAWGGAMKARLREGGMRQMAVEKGLAMEEEMDAMVVAWDELIENEAGVVGCLHGELLVTK